MYALLIIHRTDKSKVEFQFPMTETWDRAPIIPELGHRINLRGISAVVVYVDWLLDEVPILIQVHAEEFDITL